MKKYQIVYYMGATISLLVGLWHFTVPWMFGWASYIPYETLVVPINYVNPLYLSGDDMDNFLFLYSDIFNQGIYNNGKSGLVDLFGINYYPPELEETIIKRLRERNSEDDRILTDWLMTADEHNGLYILGV